VFGLEQFATSDLRSVSKIAIKTPSFGSLTPNDYTVTLSDVLNMSGSLEELLVVEEKLYQKLVGNGDRLAGLLRDHRKDCMVEGFEVLDCDAADVLAYEIPAGEMVGSGHLSMETHCMLNEGKNWKECEYFEKIAKGLEEKLSRHRDEKAGKEICGGRCGGFEAWFLRQGIWHMSCWN
jgi:hypothetical protein